MVVGRESCFGRDLRVVISLAQQVQIAVSDWPIPMFCRRGVIHRRTPINTQLVWRKEFFYGIGLLLQDQGHMASFKTSTSFDRPPLSLLTPTSSPFLPSCPLLPPSIIEYVLNYTLLKKVDSCDMAPIRFAFHSVCLQLTSRKTAAHERSLRNAKFYSIYYGGKNTKVYRLSMKMVRSLSNGHLIFLE